MKYLSAVLLFLISLVFVVSVQACVFQTCAHVNIVPALKIEAALETSLPSFLGVVLSGPAYLGVNVHIEGVVGCSPGDGPGGFTAAGWCLRHDADGRLELGYGFEGDSGVRNVIQNIIESSDSGGLLLRLEYE